MDMPRLSVFLAVSLDGCIAGPGGDLTWLDRCAGDGPEETGYAALMASVDTLLLGRSTYDTVLGFDPWPYAGKEVRVFTHRPLSPRHGERPCAGTLREVVEALAASGARHLYVDGGAVVRQALAAGLVTDLTLHFIPELLGGGVRLFEENLPPSHWQLLSSKALASGALQAVYGPLR